MVLVIMSWIATICSICGNYFVNRKHVFGMWIWAIGSLLWVIYAIYNHIWSQLVMYSIYSYFNIEGIIKWSKKGVI